MSNISKSKKDPEYLKQQAIKKKEYRDKKKAQMKIGENMIAKNDLYKIFENMKTRKDTPLSKISINNYIAKLNKISQLVEEHDFIDYKFLEDTKKVLHALNASSLKSKKDYMTPIIKVLQHYKVSEDLIKNYRNVLGEHKDKEDKIRGDNKLQKQKDKDNAMSLEDINKKYNEYKIYKDEKIDANKLLYKLIVAFYFKNNVILRNDLPNFKIASDKKKELNKDYNYIILKGDNPNKIIMLNYKTAPTYGKQTFDITNELSDLLKEYIKLFKKQSGDYLFSTPDGNPILRNTFLKYITKSMDEVLGSPLNIDLIRSIIISHYYDKPMSINEKKELARRFLHSANVQQEYVKMDLLDD
jgi:hypothetical protein